LNNKEIISQNASLENGQSYDSIDFGKLWLIAKKSFWIVVLIFILSGSIGYLIVRYTKPLYESEAIIKLNFESEANNLGLVQNSNIQNNLNDISGEIELIKSKLFISRVIQMINYPVAYYAYGTYLVDERFGNSPFEVSFEVRDNILNDRPIDVEIISMSTYRLSYDGINGRTSSEHLFGQELILPEGSLRIDKTDALVKDMFGRYFFLLNSEEQMINYFNQNLTVQPENFNAKTIRLALADYNKYKARSFLNQISALYLQYSKEEKNLTIEQKIVFLDSLIASVDGTIQEYEDYFENFTIENKTVNLQSDLI
jgi:tyrosine-protein kinase Etk/Wzc